MIESQNPQIDVQELMARIRVELESRKAQPLGSPGRPPSTPPAGTPETAASPSYPLRANIAAALNRARQKDHVDRRIPPLFHPLFRNQGGVNYQLLHAIELQVQQIDALRDELADLQQASRREVADLRTALVGSLHQIKTAQTETSQLLHAIELQAQQINALRDELADLQQASRREVADLRTELVDGFHQIETAQTKTSELVSGLRGILKEQHAQHASTHKQVHGLEKRLAELTDRVAPKITSLNFDAFYLAFENQFRGSRDDVKDRSRIYLPYLAAAGVGTADKPLLDLGCGRGEWLELLRESGYTARGVDVNESMVAICRKAGLEVEQNDALAYLKLLPDASLGAVTGFHVIEHSPFPVLMNLIAETRRVLQPGGLAIFETPNPNNIQVGASRFYMDPTHVRPLPPLMTQFLFETAGLSKVEILKLHPFPPDHLVQGDNQMLVERFNQFFYGPQDYSVIAYKSG